MVGAVGALNQLRVYGCGSADPFQIRRDQRVEKAANFAASAAGQLQRRVVEAVGQSEWVPARIVGAWLFHRAALQAARDGAQGIFPAAASIGGARAVAAQHGAGDVLADSAAVPMFGNAEPGARRFKCGHAQSLGIAEVDCDRGVARRFLLQWHRALFEP